MTNGRDSSPRSTTPGDPSRADAGASPRFGVGHAGVWRRRGVRRRVGRRGRWIVLVLSLSVGGAATRVCGRTDGGSQESETHEPRGLRAAAGSLDITPEAGLPLWGYGGRKDLPAGGTRDRLRADVLVLEVAGARLAIVGLDTGRAPARSSMERLRARARESAGVDHLLVVGSHTHHGPCWELERTEPTATWIRSTIERIGAEIERCAREARPAKLAVTSGECELNRNRHTRRTPKPVDRTMIVLRVVDLEDRPIATAVNWAAHPTSLPASRLEYSADFPGALKRAVEERLGGVCIYLQGAVGDLSADRRGLDVDDFGRAVAGRVIELVQATRPEAPAGLRLVGASEELRFESPRVDLADPWTYLKYVAAFFKPLIDAYVEEYREGIRPALDVVLLGEDVGIVGVSGELFCQHALRLRERARLRELLVLGCCNGYHQYFPTIEAAAEGGYGADPTVSPVEIGAGERIMDRALILLYRLRGQLEAR